MHCHHYKEILYPEHKVQDLVKIILTLGKTRLKASVAFDISVLNGSYIGYRVSIIDLLKRSTINDKRLTINDLHARTSTLSK